MRWWFKRHEDGRRGAIDGNGERSQEAVEKATGELREAILRRRQTDKLVALIREEWRATR